jgi:hypothetical protein
MGALAQALKVQRNNPVLSYFDGKAVRSPYDVQTSHNKIHWDHQHNPSKLFARRRFKTVKHKPQPGKVPQTGTKPNPPRRGQYVRVVTVRGVR